ncbi:MAG: 2-oxoacid:acceptor oxidoreductase subunit alpha [Candidatus Eisenbacteria bacterium]|nr:2-oxoacid:acceptor oxidoreductase subunit alpha [Candidatus Eisenbacteria bacterium]
MAGRDVFTFLVGGQAGQGVKSAAGAASEIIAGLGRETFQLDDYQSLIRGGHSFSVVSSAPDAISSQYGRADLVVALDARSYDEHRGDLAEGGVLVRNSDEVEEGDGIGVPITSAAEEYPRPMLRSGVAAVAVLCSALGKDEGALAETIARIYSKDSENNVAFAKAVYGSVNDDLNGRFELDGDGSARTVLAGSQAVCLGAAAAGLDVYIAYPMTPASPLLHFLSAHDEDLSVVTVHPESEIAVANMALGCAMAGARAMVGTSGGGYALMEEAFSLAGMSESPCLFFLGQRSGPATGVPTYTEQGDLRFAIHAGHGEFARIVASPGDVAEAFRLSAELLDLAWRFQSPAVLLSDKHLSECTATAEIVLDDAAWAEPVMHEGGDYVRYADTKNGVSPLLFPPSGEMIKWTSYEHDERGVTTEEAGMIARMHEKRQRKTEALEEHVRSLHTVNRFGEKGPLIFTYGSTTMSVLEAVRAGSLEARVVQPIYLEPFPSWQLEEFRGEHAVVVEASVGGQFARFLEEKAGLVVDKVIRRYDGRPFDPVELADELGKSSA